MLQEQCPRVRIELQVCLYAFDSTCFVQVVELRGKQK